MSILAKAISFANIHHDNVLELLQKLQKKYKDKNILRLDERS